MLLRMADWPLSTYVVLAPTTVLQLTSERRQPCSQMPVRLRALLAICNVFPATSQLSAASRLMPYREAPEFWKWTVLLRTTELGFAMLPSLKIGRASCRERL